MTENTQIAIELRTETGKGSARTLRRAGKIPAIIYGGKAVQKIVLESRTLNLEFNKGAFLSKVFELSDGKKKFKAIAREVQLHPVSDQPIHVDFLEVTDKTQIKVRIKVNFINKSICAGLKKGGVLSVVRHKIELFCPAGEIPGELTVDLTDVKIGDSIHVSAIDLPKGVVPTITDRDFTIATVAGRGTQDDEIDEVGESTDAEEEVAAE